MSAFSPKSSKSKKKVLRIGLKKGAEKVGELLKVPKKVLSPKKVQDKSAKKGADKNAQKGWETL